MDKQAKKRIPYDPSISVISLWLKIALIHYFLCFFELAGQIFLLVSFILLPLAAGSAGMQIQGGPTQMWDAMVPFPMSFIFNHVRKSSLHGGCWAAFQGCDDRNCRTPRLHNSYILLLVLVRERHKASPESKQGKLLHLWKGQLRRICCS
jgi:hypothetical protein